MRFRHFLSSALIVPLVLACASAPTKATSRELVLGAASARLFDHQRHNMCALPPDRLVTELLDMQHFLAAFLQETGAGPRGLWTAEQLAILEKGQALLPKALNTFELTLEGAAPCPFDSAYGIFPLVEESRRLVRQTRSRLEEAPLLVNVAKQRRELAAWKKDQPEQRSANRDQWCKEEKKSPTIYYAAEDENGTLTWEFCDGMAASRKGDEALKLDSSAMSNAKRIKENAYRDAIAQYPPEEILRAPKIPPLPSNEE